jgi:MoxR-like ATPase
MEKIISNQSSRDIANFLADRLARENVISEKEVSNEKISEKDAEKLALELINLTLEKQDLLRAIQSDEDIVNNSKNKKRREISQDDILNRLNSEDPIDFRMLSLDFSPEQNIHDAISETKKDLDDVSQKIGLYSSNPKVLESYKNILQEKIDIIKLARQVENMQKLLDRVYLSESLLLARRNNEDVKITKADKEVLEKNKKISEKVREKISELMEAPEIYYEVKRRELLDYREEYLKGGFVETPSEKKKISEILSHLQLGIPVFLRGDLGAGKTEVLRHISNKYYGSEPEFISGSDEATKYDIYGKTQIGIRSEEDKVSEYKMRLDEYKKMYPESSAEDLEKTEKELYNHIVAKGQTTSFFQYGPLVRAMKEGKPLIIDEIDAIPHSILIRLNHFLTRRVGDKVKIQENGGEEITVKEGFCIMATGNIKGAKYKREDLDPAFLSRWWSSKVNYLPQDETLKILIASLIDKRGNLDLKNDDDLGKVEMLTKVAEETQKIFSGEKTDVTGYGGDAVKNISASLDKSVLSMRDLWNIVKPWKAGNFDKPLDDYIFSEFIKKATENKDAIYLTQLCCRFGFFKDWKANDFKIVGLDDRKLEAFKATTNN